MIFPPEMDLVLYMFKTRLFQSALNISRYFFQPSYHWSLLLFRDMLISNFQCWVSWTRRRRRSRRRRWRRRRGSEQWGRSWRRWRGWQGGQAGHLIMTIMLMMIRLITLMMMIVNYVEAGHRSGRRLIVRVQRPSLVVGWIWVNPVTYQYLLLTYSSFYLKTSFASGSVHGSKWQARSLGTLQRWGPSDNQSIW